MGSLFSRKEGNTEATVEFWPDKVIKYGVIPPLLLLAIIAIILLYAVDKVNCTTNRTRDIYPISDVNQYCWHNLKPARLETIVNYTIYNHTLFSSPPPNATKVTYDSWVEGAALFRHKIFPILLFCECVCLALPLLIWFWCIEKEVRSHTKALVAHANRLTAAYRKYDHSQSKQDEASVHRELDNYLEYLSYLLSSKAQRIFILHLTKWIVMLIVCIAWFGGNLGLFSPDFVIFQNSFTCLYNRANNLTYECYFGTSTYLRDVWYINIVVLGILIILILLYIIIGLCRTRRYENTFFHGSIPGAMDGRLSKSVQKNFNSRHYWLLSKMCEENEAMFDDPGLAKSLARKYGSYQKGQDQMGDNSGPEADEKPAFVKQAQVDRFQKTADDSDKSSPLCCGSCLGTASSNGGSENRRSPEPNLGNPGNQGIPEPGPVFRQDNIIDSKQPVSVSDNDFTQKKQLHDRDGKEQIVGNGEVGRGNVPNSYLNQGNSPRDKMDLPKDFSPDHLYFRELIRYKRPNGIKPEYPVDHRPASLLIQQDAHPDSYPPGNTWNGSTSKTLGPYEMEPGVNEDYPKSVSFQKSQPPSYGTWRTPRRAVFRLPRQWRRGRVKKRRIASVSAKDPDVIVLEDIEEYTQSNIPPRSTEPQHGGHKLHYPSPYSGPLSSKVIMPYYDVDTGTYTDLNPLAFKVRKTVREKMARDSKVWKP